MIIRRMMSSALVSAVLFFFLTTPAAAGSSDESLVRAKIGILISSETKNKMARSRDRLRAGEMLRLYIHPEKAAYIYVVYSDKQTAMLLNRVELKTAGTSLVLPSAGESYEIDGASRFEMFTIICSPQALPEISALLADEAPHEQWAALEKKLTEKSRIELTEKEELPFAIAGNVRGGVKSGPGPEAVKKLRIYTGRHFVVKKFEFSIKK